jgi:hypothetical protein
MSPFIKWYIALGFAALALQLLPFQFASGASRAGNGRWIEPVPLQQSMLRLGGNGGFFGMLLTSLFVVGLWPVAVVLLRMRHAEQRSFSQSLAQAAAGQKGKPGRVAPEWLVRRVTPEEVTQALGARARALLEPRRPGDELWIYSTPKAMWDKNDGTEWMVLVREGYILAYAVTRRS